MLAPTPTADPHLARLAALLPGRPTPATLPPDRTGPDGWRALYRDPDPRIGNVYAPRALLRGVSYPGAAGLRVGLREVGICHVVHRRPVRDPATGRLLRYDVLTTDLTHNERVDRGAVRSDLQFGWGGTPSTTHLFTVIAVANAALTKTKTDESLGSASADATTNEFTTLGLSRAAATIGAYTAPSALGNTYSRVLSKLFTATGSATAKGSGVFTSTTVAGSFLYVEDNHTDAVLVTNDTYTPTWTISN